jgi:hypothetical protein
MLRLLIESKLFVKSICYSVISEEEDVIMSHSSDTDHEEDHEDEMDKKQTSFN